MNEQHIKDNGTEALRLASSGRSIPIEFIAELPLRVPIKIQPQYSMSHPSNVSEKAILPALFQLAARMDDAKLATAFRSVLTLNRECLPEKALDREKLEGILKAIAKRKKTTRR
jgi:hypothetical protein